MFRLFQKDLFDSSRFIMTLELVPGRESFGQSLDTLKGIAADAFADGRISAVSITDNPGGNPALSPDVIGREIFSVGMDVIVHFACRDMNRAGMESRALQLSLMGMKNILALTGDYTSKGFGGRGAPVFDLDSVNLLAMLNLLNERVAASGDPDGFVTGAVVSPFKYTEAESFVQYAKLCRKAAAGAQFVITQLGYDVCKFDELLKIQRRFGINLPILGSVYLLSPRAARAMNRGVVPGAVISEELLKAISEEWKDPRSGLAVSIERTAKLISILKGLGYKGAQIGGIHRSFKTVARILDQVEKIENDWQDYLDEFTPKKRTGFYAFAESFKENGSPRYGGSRHPVPVTESIQFNVMQMIHRFFFDFKSPLEPFLEAFCRKMDQNEHGRAMAKWIESVPKKLLLECQTCGDCGIQHTAFLCPEAKCPKHTRNGACGGSTNGGCEVYPDRRCVWFRAYQRWASKNRIDELATGCVPPRMWELNDTPSWLNFHLKRDHQSASSKIAQFCRTRTCRLPNNFQNNRR
ncbi:methylenetetrahydrofolate reductase C-terminal domain-containing protein [Thermodesulfobacteriota bacterium]